MLNDISEDVLSIFKDGQVGARERIHLQNGFGEVVKDVKRLAQERIFTSAPDLRLSFKSASEEGKVYIIHTHFDYNSKLAPRNHCGVWIPAVGNWFQRCVFSWILQFVGIFAFGDSQHLRSLQRLSVTPLETYVMKVMDHIQRERGLTYDGHESVATQALAHLMQITL